MRFMTEFPIDQEDYNNRRVALGLWIAYTAHDIFTEIFGYKYYMRTPSSAFILCHVS